MVFGSVEAGRDAAVERLGVAGRTEVAWGLAGGLIGAVVVAGHMFTGALSSSVGFLTATVAYLIGAVVGFVHGGVLGYLGRSARIEPLEGLRRLALGAMVALPALLVGWAVAVVLALSAAAYLAGRYVTLAATLAGWAAALGVFVWAGLETRRAWRRVRERWPGARVLLIMVVGAAVALLPLFLVVRPEIWVLGVEPTPVAAVLMALAASAWIVGPGAVLVVMGLEWRRGHPGLEAPPHA